MKLGVKALKAMSDLHKSDGFETITTLLEIAPEFVPVADQVADVLLAYGPTINKVFTAVKDAFIASNIKTFKTYLDAGFTREEAMQLILHNQLDWSQVLKNISITNN